MISQLPSISVKVHYVAHCQKYLSTICLFGDGCIRYELLIAEQQNDVSKIQTAMVKLLWWYTCMINDFIVD